MRINIITMFVDGGDSKSLKNASNFSMNGASFHDQLPARSDDNA